MHRSPLPLLRYLLLSCLLCSAELSLRQLLSAELDVRQVIATAQRADLRVFQGQHLLLLTDCPAGPDDDLANLPGVFDEAFRAWCRHYDLAADEQAHWQAVGCVVVDPERFRNCGLLPAEIPAFENGFCAGQQFWLMDQSNPAYRRHLLLHEGVHAFTITLRRLHAPPWYTEGIAELLATHRLNDGAFESTPIPLAASDVEQLGRIEAVRELRLANTAPSLTDVFSTPAREHHRIPDYAASWASVAFLSQHPRYREAFAAVEAGPLDGRLTARLLAADGFDVAEANRDFDAFTQDVDYGYDLERMAVDWTPGQPLQATVRLFVDPSRGWQNTAVQLASGQRVRFASRGRSQLGRLPNVEVDLESEGQGISLAWYRGRPLGRLLFAQWVDPDDGQGRPGFRVLAEGPRGRLTAATAGPLFVRINDSPQGRADNTPGLEIALLPD